MRDRLLIRHFLWRFVEHDLIAPTADRHEVFAITAGTIVTVKGVVQGDPIKEQAFFNALLRIWLGPAPADYKLKDALLGIKG